MLNLLNSMTEKSLDKLGIPFEHKNVVDEDEDLLGGVKYVCNLFCTLS